MMFVVYNKDTGLISRYLSIPENELEQNIDAEKEATLLCSGMLASTHIIDGVPTKLPAPAKARELLLADIRQVRNQKLTACDWTQVADAPLSPEQKTAWAAYRQALRDFPEVCDPVRPVWPVAP